MAIPDNAEKISSNLRQRITSGELFALALAFSAIGVFIWLSPEISYAYFDFKIYINTAQNNFAGYYYGYWLLPIFAAFARLPLNLSYFLWCSINILGVFFASRIFGGKAALALSSYQMFYSIIYGGIAGVIVGALALCWWGIINKNWTVTGVGIAIASAKYQIGIPTILFFLLIADISWKERVQGLILPIFVWLASLVIYPGWPLHTLNNILSSPPNDFGSISLWRWIGPWALLAWIPPFLLPLAPHRRLVLLVATMGLALPYFQQTDLLLLLSMPIGWISLLGNLGYLLAAYGWTALQVLAIVPLLVYIINFLPVTKNLGPHPDSKKTVS